MLILGIESSCDDTSAALVQDGRKVLSCVVASQSDEHSLYGGVVPEIASRRHCEAIVGVTEQALSEAGLSMADVSAVAVTCAPGLIGSLLVGVNFAKGLALSAGLPLVPVHHLRGHIASNYLTYPDLEPPFLCLVVSGGHSHIVDVQGYDTLHVVARTRDDAAGEAFDKIARALGLPYPGGVALDRIAESGGDPNAFSFPRPKVDGAPMDFSFSGIKTAALNALNRVRMKGGAADVEDMCASFRLAVADYLVSHLRMAVRETGARRIAAAGGVSANRLLRRMLQEMAREEGAELFLPELRYCGDNAAMIAAQGYYELGLGHTAGVWLNAGARMDICESFTASGREGPLLARPVP